VQEEKCGCRKKKPLVNFTKGVDNGLERPNLKFSVLCPEMITYMGLLLPAPP